MRVEYHMLDGNVFEKDRITPYFPPPEGGFVSQINEEPVGMFIITKVESNGTKFILNQVDCDPIHWKGNESGRASGPGDDCSEKECAHQKNCPISTHIMLMADTTE